MPALAPLAVEVGSWYRAAAEPQGAGSTDVAAIVVACFLIVYTAVIAFTFVLHYFDAASGEEAPPPIDSYLRAFAVEWWYCFALLLLYPFVLIPRSRFRCRCDRATRRSASNAPSNTDTEARGSALKNKRKSQSFRSSRSA